jgi:hypothetical protein
MDEKKQADFPLWWLNESKRNIEGLREIASHLREKTASMRYASGGYRGSANEMDAQLITALNRVEAQVSVLSDVVQATLQIIVDDHERKKNRVRKTLARIWAAVHKWLRAIAENPFYRFVGIARTAVFALGILGGLWLLIRHFLHVR